MDVIATLIEAVVFNPVTNLNETIRLTNRNDPRATAYNNLAWLPILEKSPDVGLSVFNGDFTGQGDISLGSFEVTLVDGLGDSLALLNWHGADIKIFAGDMTTGVFPQIFRCLGNGASRKGRLALEVQLVDKSEALNSNLLYLSYAGIGGLEGNVGVRGVLKPMVFGDAKYVGAVLIDDVRQIYQVHGYGPVENIYAVFEGGKQIGNGPAGDYTAAQLSAFINDVHEQGTWIRLNAYGLIRLGSAPSFPITAHVLGDTGGVVGGTCLKKAGDLVKRYINLATSLTVKQSSVTALNTAQVGQFNDYMDTQTTVADACQAILLGFGGYLTFDENGELILGRVRFGASQFTLSGTNDQLPTVLGVNQLPASSPVWLLRLSAEETHYVHQSTEVVGSLHTLTEDLKLASGKNKTYPPSSVPPTGVPPVGVVDGDLWPDTSVVPTVTRRYDAASGTWIAIGSYVTQGTDIGVENGATKGAPVGTLVAGRNSQDVVNDIDLNTNGILEEMLRTNLWRNLLDERTFIGDKEVGTVIAEFSEEYSNSLESFAGTLNLLGAKNEDGTAFILDANAVRVTPTQSMATRLNDITVELGDQSGQITNLQTIVIGPQGTTAKAVLKLDVNGKISGFQNTNDGTISAFEILTDSFKIVSSNGGLPYTPFSVVNGTIRMTNVEVDTIKIGAVLSNNIALNAVTKKSFWIDNFGGSASGASVAPSAGVFGTFGLSSSPAQVTVTDIPVGADVAIRIYINAQRTGGDNDRIQFRLKRLNPGGGTVFLETINVGLTSAPSTIAYEWNHLNVGVAGTYTYVLEALRSEGDGTYYNAKMIVDAGKR